MVKYQLFGSREIYRAPDRVETADGVLSGAVELQEGGWTGGYPQSVRYRFEQDDGWIEYRINMDEFGESVKDMRGESKFDHEATETPFNESGDAVTELSWATALDTIANERDTDVATLEQLYNAAVNKSRYSNLHKR